MSAKEKEKDINLRRMAQTDIDAVLALDRKVGRGQNHITYRDMIATDPCGPLDLSFVAEIDNKVVGFVLARLAYLYIPFTEVCLIHGIVADPEYRGHHIGSKLVNELISHCELEGINTVRALVAEHDTELRKFVEYLGFRRSNITNYDKTFES